MRHLSLKDGHRGGQQADNKLPIVIDSLVSEVSTTAKKSWTRTKEALNPMRLIPAGFRQNSETKPDGKTVRTYV